MDFDYTSTTDSIRLILDQLDFLMNELTDILDSSKFAMYLAIVGFCMSIMDHFNKKLSNKVEEAMLIVFHKIKELSWLFLSIIALSTCAIISWNIYQNENIILKYIPDAQRYHKELLLFVAALILILFFFLLVHVVDFNKGNHVTSTALLLMATGLYYEMKSNEYSIWIACGIALFAFVMMITSSDTDDKHKLKNLTHEPLIDNNLRSVSVVKASRIYK